MRTYSMRHLFLLLIAAVILTSATTAHANGLPTGECSITTSAPKDPRICSEIDTAHAVSPDGSISSPLTYIGVRSDPGAAGLPIDAWNYCRWVDNISSAHNSLFVPLRSSPEWTAFINNHPAADISLAFCARPGTTTVPANDPANPASDSDAQCYDQNHNLQATTQSYYVGSYGREGDTRTATPVGMSFDCYDADGNGPWTKTVTSVTLKGLSADRAGGSNASRSSPDWQAVAVTYSGGPPVAVNGACGSTVNGQTVSSAPSGAELCNAGTPTTVAGTGPWTWTCQGANGGTDSTTCTANHDNPVCPSGVYSSYLWLSPTYGGGSNGVGLTVNYTGITATPVTIMAESHGTTRVPGGPLGFGQMGYYSSYFGGKCSVVVVQGNSPTVTATINGTTETAAGHWTTVGPGSNRAYVDFLNCIATSYASANLPGYEGCTTGTYTGTVMSPLKVNLAGGDAKLNSDRSTNFYLTLQDGRILEGHVKGGLNTDEGWLMVRRSDKPLVYDNGALNADNWFGDRDHRSINGYTDLAETFKDFIVQDDRGQHYIPLHVLNEDEKNTPMEAGKVTNPSRDLLVVDVNDNMHFASEFFDRIYTDYRNVVEGDGKDGKSGDNLILERGIVHTIQGENHGAVDQWFVLDLPADYSDPGHPTMSKVLAATDSAR